MSTTSGDDFVRVNDARWLDAGGSADWGAGFTHSTDDHILVGYCWHSLHMLVRVYIYIYTQYICIYIYTHVYTYIYIYYIYIYIVYIYILYIYIEREINVIVFIFSSIYVFIDLPVASKISRSVRMKSPRKHHQASNTSAWEGLTPDGCEAGGESHRWAGGDGHGVTGVSENGAKCWEKRKTMVEYVCVCVYYIFNCILYI